MSAPTAKPRLIKGATGDWEVVIGMGSCSGDVPVKLFPAPRRVRRQQLQVSLVDAATPGMLPVINEVSSRLSHRPG
jgi:aspartyl-tRNA(Asn)/glutamyl-tRNA(Gln) amidotransferase subunit B